MKKRKYYLNREFYIFLSIIIILSIIFIIGIGDDINSINANNGYVVINDDVNLDESYNIAGDVRYYKNEIVLNQSADNYEFTNFSIYNDYLSGNYGTLNIAIDNQTDESYAITFDKFYNPYNIYMDGDTIFEKEGIYYFSNKSLILEIPPNKVSMYDISLNRDNIFLMGFNQSPVITGYENALIKDSISNSVNFYLALLVIFLIFTIVYFWIKSDKENISYLFLIAMGIDLLLRYLLKNNITGIFIYYSNYIDFKYFMISSVISTFFFYSFVYFKLYRNRKKRALYAVSVFITTVYLLVGIFTKSDALLLVYDLSLIYKSILLILTLYIGMSSISEVKENSSITLIVSFLTILVFSLDMLQFHNIETSIFYILQYILLTLIVVVSEYFYYAKSTIKYRNILDNLSYEIDKRAKIITNENKALEVEIKEQKDKEKDLIAITNKDKLTNVYNRYFANNILDDLMNKYRQFNHVFSVIIIDIDNFKYINDTYGHDIGDEALKSVANTIVLNTKGTDYVVRWGGEEFLVILNNASISSGIYVAEKIRKAVAELEIDIIGKLTISLGVAEIKPDISFEDVINSADEGLYKAKKSGKNYTFPKIV